jgi:hypothetical protein
VLIMHALGILDVAVVAIALAGGFALGTMFGRILVSDLAALIHSMESRLSAVEHTVGGNSAAPSPASAAVHATHQHAAALREHAHATEKLAGAIAASASAAASAPHAAAPISAAKQG